MSLRTLLLALVTTTLALNLSAAEDDGYYDDDFFDPVGIQPEEPAAQPAEDTGPPMLGIQMTPPPRRVSQRENLDPEQGVYVFRVYPDTAADALGIQPGDVILEVNGEPVGSMSDLREAVAAAAVGQDAQVVVSREGGNQVSLGGAAFREWPEDIPWQRIDSDAERRYRNRQKSRLARDMDSLGELDQQIAGLEGDLAAGLDKLAGLERARDRAAAIDGEPVLPLALMALPAWRFGYQIAVGDEELPAQLETVPPSPLAAIAPPFAIDYSIAASSEAL